MAKGKAKSNYLGREGVVTPQTVPSWEFIYEASLVKNPKYNIGDRVVLPDGRVFRYAKSGSALNVDVGCSFAEDEVETYRTVLTATAVGDTSITIDGNSHAELTKDELRGGYVIVYHTGGGGDTQFRGIIGNDAAAANADFTIYLDGPLDHATIAATTGIEVFYNPYANLTASLHTKQSKAGKPAIQVAAANTYFWVQTWGPCWLAPQLTSFGDNNDRAGYWRHDGSIEGEIANTSKDVNLNSTQYAGFLINEGLTSGPLFMLQVSP